MIIICPSCKKKFEVDSNIIPEKGKLLKCGSCDQTWFFNKHNQKNIKAEIINITTIKPLDEKVILQSIQKTNCAVTCEEHQILGGLGSSIAQLIAKHKPIPLEFVGVNDTFGESGKPIELMHKYKIDKDSIWNAAIQVVKRKK